MALKLELEQWQHACEAFDARDYDTALRSFYNMADNAKMHFNIGLILAALEDHERAVAAYSTAIAMDPYFAVAYFQMGVSHFVLNDMEAARRDFDLAYEKLRGNPIINYQQLGLAFRLYGCEVLFNRGICQLYLGKIDAGLTDLYHAQKSKMTEEHDIIDQAVRDRGRGYSVYSIPTGVLYRPPEARLQQMRGINMFAAIDKLHKLQQGGNNQKSGIKRNNSVLLPQPRARQPLPFQPQRSPTQQPIQTRQRQYSAERKRKDSNVEEWEGASQPSTSSTSSFGSRYTSRRVDSGFDEDRYSSSSASTYRSTPRSSSHTKHRVSPPPVPPIPRSDSATNFDQELDEVYGSLQNMSVERDRRCGRERLNSSSSTLALQPSTSTSSSLSSSPKIKCKVHYTDCRILLVPAHTTFDEFLNRIRTKLNAPDVRLQYKDEDDELVLMIDDDDLHMARQIARVRASPDGVERLEIWCVQ